VGLRPLLSTVFEQKLVLSHDLFSMLVINGDYSTACHQFNL